jgi:hypothetical protein
MDEWSFRTNVEGAIPLFAYGYWGTPRKTWIRLSVVRTDALNQKVLLFIVISGVGLSPLGTAATSGLLYKPQMIDEGDCGAIGEMKIGRGNRSTRRNEDWQGKPKYSEKTCPSATLSTTNPTWPDLGSNPGRRGGKLATNRLSYGAALIKR